MGLCLDDKRMLRMVHRAILHNVGLLQALIEIRLHVGLP